MQQGRQQQEPTEATQGRFNAAPERRKNLQPLGWGGCQRQFNTSILVDRGEIIGKYRKIHIPVYEAPEARIGMCICNDRRWPETYRVMGLQSVDVVMVGYNTPIAYGRRGEPAHLPFLHNHLSLQASAYQNACWVAAAAKAGVEEGIPMIGGSCIVAPTGEIAVQALSEDDEVINYVCDLDMANGYRGNIFNFARHRRPEHYKAIVERVGAEPTPL